MKKTVVPNRPTRAIEYQLSDREESEKDSDLELAESLELGSDSEHNSSGDSSQGEETGDESEGEEAEVAVQGSNGVIDIDDDEVQSIQSKDDTTSTAVATSHSRSKGAGTDRRARDTAQAPIAVQAPLEIDPTGEGWSRLNLSRPLLRALADLKFDAPTPIQKAAIPQALQGRDVLGTAQTGSGKTAAFVLPILERLCQSVGVKSRKVSREGIISGGWNVTKALILLPTRELAVQCFEMLEALAKYCPVTKVLVSGGMSQKTQEATFRQQPDIVVATPGRVLDLLLNSPNVHLEMLEIVVMDEADRLLELGFKEECISILKRCCKARQTLLFSATLSEAIRDLAALSLKRPIRVDASVSHSLASTLEQVLVKVPEDEKERMPATVATRPTASQKKRGEIWSSVGDIGAVREAILFHLLLDVYHDKKAIVFFRTKKGAHRASLICRLLEVDHAELHGNLAQAARLEALQKFHSGSARFMICSELASRGLDFPDVDVVINVCVPPDAARYVHQVGRTARIGKNGTAVTLYAPNEKLRIKKIIRQAAVQHMNKGKKLSDDAMPETKRLRPDATAVENWRSKIQGFAKQLVKLITAEHLERELRLAERDAQKATNTCLYRDEIISRPPRRWLTTVERSVGGRSGKGVQQDIHDSELLPFDSVIIADGRNGYQDEAVDAEPRWFGDDETEATKGFLARETVSTKSAEGKLADNDFEDASALGDDDATLSDIDGQVNDSDEDQQAESGGSSFQTVKKRRKEAQGAERGKNGQREVRSQSSQLAVSAKAASEKRFRHVKGGRANKTPRQLEVEEARYLAKAGARKAKREQMTKRMRVTDDDGNDSGGEQRASSKNRSKGKKLPSRAPKNRAKVTPSKGVRKGFAPKRKAHNAFKSVKKFKRR